ncbi:BspA family leucine-rich repeat surface protein [Pediococcus pentosaceus]|uniref:BspA family leucine-rich repeat surface protein n=2 Tax=Pediococcus pentosaceus TaxID=1255 RepID=UPI0020734829|nr:BspA family leucine-rich repeat surface protein [Pediococcus pentosaceus]MCM6792870.1 BspA family leucine-rich repeat surface protein [Pediococcus pentosaceus]
MYASKTHFKMYKSGKRWLFVGLTAMGLVVGAVNASTDVMADTVTENTTITEKNKSEKEQDVAKENTTHVEATEIQKNTDSNNTSAASEDTVAKTDEASTSKVSEKVATAENAQATSDSSKDTNSNSKLSKQNNDSINEASVKDNHKTSKAAVTNNTVTSNKVADDTTSSNTTITESKTNTTPVSKNTDSDQSLVNKDTTREATTNIDNDIDTTQPQEHQKGTDVDVSKALANATVNEDKKSIDNQKKKDEAKKEATKANDNIASGTFGSSDWYIDAQGTLHFGAGEFGVSQIDVVSNNGLEINKNEWGKYASQIKKISFDDKVIANQQSGALFNGLSNLTTIENMQNFDTSNITVMDAIFYDDTNLTDIDVSQWDLSNVYSMYGTFFKCTSVSNLDVSQWNVSKVENMAYAFYEMTNLKALDVSNWDTSNVTNMFYTFLKDGLITVLDVSNWDVSNVEKFTGTFSGMSGVKTLDVSHWDTGSATAKGSLFQDTNSLSTLDVSNWNVSNVLSLDFTFLNTGVKTLDVSKWDVSKVTNFFGTFEGVKFSRLDVSDWKTVSATNMSYMFCGSSFGTLNISNLNTDHVVDMSLMFNGIDVKSLDLSSFNTSNVTNMKSMFHGAKSIYKLDISNFDMGKVTNKEGMLTDLTSLRVLVLGSNTIINGTGLSEPNFKSTSNRWVAVAGGNENNPYGAKYYTSTDLMAAYNSSMSDTYVIGEDKSSIAGHDSTIIAGPNSKWTSSDNFSSGTGIDGSPLDFSKVVVGGTVDTETPGNYDVSYTYTDEAGKEVMDTITVHVVASQVSIAGHDSTIIAGPNSKWNAKDNFDSVTDAEGNPVELNKVSVTGEANAQVPGDYEITYSYTDIYGNEANETITVHVIASQASVAGHDSTIIAGPNSKWNASDNFDSATDAEGNLVEFKDVTANSQVDTQVPGNYDVVYSYIDAYGNKVSKTITVHVIASQAGIDSHDSTIIAGSNSKWNTSDNLDSATDAEGNPVELNKVSVTGEANAQVPGDYEITYSYTDIYGNEANETITVHVIASATPNTPSNPDRPDKSADTDVPDTSMKPSNSDTVGLPTKSKSNNLVKITNKRVANIVPAKKHSKPISTSKVNTLPQTGENDSNIETTIGVMGLLASVMGLIGFGKRRNRED